MSNATTTEVLNKGLKRQFHVEVPSDHVQKNVDLLIREKGKKYKENGFRPGKVPLARLQEIFGGAVLEDAIKQTVQQTVAAFLKEKQLNPVLKPEYTVESYDDEKGLSYKIDLELFPEVPEISEEGLEIQKVSCRISEKEVEDFLKELAKSNFQNRPLKKARASQKGDVLHLVMELFPEGAKEKRTENVEFILEETELPPEIFEALMGKKVGEVVETQIAFSKEVPDRKIAGKTVDARFSIEEILERVPFELGEELAQFLKFETLEKLQENARKNLDSQGEALAFLWTKRQILDFFEKKYLFDVPEKLVDIEYHAIWKQTYQDLNIPEVGPEKDEEKKEREAFFKQEVGKTEEELKSFYRKISERRVRLGFVLTQLGQKMGIKLTTQESQNALFQEMMKHPGKEKEVAQYYRSNPQAFSRLQSPVFEDKLLRHISEMKPSEPKSLTKEEIENLLETDLF
jgi:trigger factor